MIRVAILCAAICCLIVGLLLIALGGLRQGVTDGEWRVISQTGLPSRASEFTWSEWQPNEGKLRPFSAYHPAGQTPYLTEFHIGHTRSFLFDYTLYQGRFQRDGINHEFSADGWKVSCRYGWPWLAFGLGACLILSHALTRERVNLRIS